MRKLVVTLLLFAAVISAAAQEFGTHWVYAPQSDSLSHVWFRRSYLCGGRPRQASVTVASSGYFKLYVNECNIGTAAFFPLRHNGDDTPVATTFDITPYLRRDTNVVAIIYSPARPSDSHRQISASFYGIAHDGSNFCYNSDDSWLCRRANSRMTADGGEAVDGRDHDPTWKAATCTSAALWLNAESYCGDSVMPMVVNRYGYHAWKTTKVTSLGYLRMSQNPVLLHVDDNFWGYWRLTLREAKRGERLQIGKLEYICNGRMDEQAFPQFALNSCGTLPVSGDSKFKPSHIFGAEMVEVGENWYNDY